MSSPAAAPAGHTAPLALLAAVVWLLAALGALPGVTGPSALAAAAVQVPVPDDATGAELPGAEAHVPAASVHAAPTPPAPPTSPAPPAALPPAGSDGPPNEPALPAPAVGDDVPTSERGSAPGRGPPAGTAT